MRVEIKTWGVDGDFNLECPRCHAIMVAYAACSKRSKNQAMAALDKISEDRKLASALDDSDLMRALSIHERQCVQFIAEADGEEVELKRVGFFPNAKEAVSDFAKVLGEGEYLNDEELSEIKGSCQMEEYIRSKVGNRPHEHE